MAWDRERATAEFAAHVAEGRPRPQSLRAWIKHNRKRLDELEWAFGRGGLDTQAGRQLQADIDWWEEVLDLAARIKKAAKGR